MLTQGPGFFQHRHPEAIHLSSQGIRSQCQTMAVAIGLDHGKHLGTVCQSPGPPRIVSERPGADFDTGSSH